MEFSSQLFINREVHNGKNLNILAVFCYVPSLGKAKFLTQQQLKIFLSKLWIRFFRWLSRRYIYSPLKHENQAFSDHYEEKDVFTVLCYASLVREIPLVASCHFPKPNGIIPSRRQWWGCSLVIQKRNLFFTKFILEKTDSQQ